MYICGALHPEHQTNKTQERRVIDLLAQADNALDGLKAVGAGLGYGLAAIGPGVGIGLVVGNATRHGSTARIRGHGANDHVPWHRLYRGSSPNWFLVLSSFSLRRDNELIGLPSGG